MKTTPASVDERTSDITQEFAGLELGDPRRETRVKKIAQAMARSPAAGFPQIVTDGSELEGLYRFLKNRNVGFDSLLEAHQEQTVRRARAAGDVVVAHDTTSFEFNGIGQAKELGYLNTGKRGFYCHASLAMDGRSLKLPLGAIAAKIWSRSAPRRTEARKKRSGAECARQESRESARWGEQVDEVEARFGSEVRPIHVMDREADSYALLAKLVERKQRFVVRMSKDRLARHAGSTDVFSQIRQLLHEEAPVLIREVPLGRRRKKTAPQANKAHPPRQPRVAKLRALSGNLELKRPRYLGKEVPSLLRVNLVRVYEVDTPADVEPVEWLLLTTEPVMTSDEIEQVIDYYRARWVIEEFFKAIKTGCAYEKRQVESLTALHNTLAITMPIAWQLLLLRGIERTHPDAPATVVLTARQVKVLRAAARSEYKITLPELPTVRQALLTIARFGGYLTWNGRPGWQVLGRGMQRLYDYEFGWCMALEAHSRGEI